MRHDDTDKRILKELKRNARISHAQLAKKVGISIPAAGRRVRAMEENGAILGYTIVLPGGTGDGVKPAAIFIRFELMRDGSAGVFEALSGHGDTIEVWETTGEWEAVAVAPHWNAGRLSEFQERMLTHPGVEQFKVVFVPSGETFDLEREAAKMECSLVPDPQSSRKVPGSAPN